MRHSADCGDGDGGDPAPGRGAAGVDRAVGARRSRERTSHGGAAAQKLPTPRLILLQRCVECGVSVHMLQ
jgi:hypothetical protein